MGYPINVESLTKVFRSSLFKPAFTAISDVTFRIEQGETFGFIGANGAGKSTTIKMLTGILTSTSGSAKLFGLDVIDPASRQGVGYVPENPLLYDYLTPMEVLEMGLSLHQIKIADRRGHCMTWLDRFGIAHVAHKRIRNFSKGMVQRTALAHALAIQPRLLILDEPLSGLDPIGRKDVVDILAEYRAQGGTIFLTSHVLHDVERLADRFGLIHQGRLRAVRSPTELTGTEDLVEVRSLGSNPVTGMSQDFDRRWSAKVPRSDLWALLEALQLAGHVLQEVKPTLSLEAAFLAVLDEKTTVV